MRKLLDTFVLVCLLVGPALVLTCVRQPATEQTAEEQTVTEEEELADLYVLNEYPRP
ncbi:MAG: hypothetical protein ACRBG0_22490 [Lewinella sp.]|jgi:hypothetical protein|uniref:hypothetical protein n=1 Tax=Lewinella sp. TaxID=2004506 RepID=UPI003D6C1780